MEKHTPDSVRFVETKWIAISKITFDDNNPNVMNKSQKESLDKVIKKYGYAKDPWLNENKDGTYLVIDGEQGLRDVIAKGVKKVRAKIFHVKYSEVRMLRQIANKLHGTHDRKKDADEFKAIFENNDLDLFSEISSLNLDDIQFELEKEFDISFETEETDDIPEPPKKPKSKLGDTYQLDKHRVMCGDCTDQGYIDKLLGNITVDQLLTDPPYGVNYSEKNEFLNSIGKGNRIQTPIINDNEKDYRQFFSSFLDVIPFSDYNTIFICMSGLELHNVRLAMDDSKITLGDYLIWLKHRIVLTRKDYNSKHEFIVYGWKGKHKFYGSKSNQTVLEYNKPNKNELHPTMKPVELFCKIIKDGSKKQMTVYDPFLGSGTTLISCEQTNRICYGMELDPIYIDVIIQRWEKLTGKKAQKITNAK